MPPRRLRVRVGAPGVKQFLDAGQHAHALEGALRTVGQSFADGGAVLDFGCGAARVLAHVQALASDGAELAGCDIDEEAIAWSARHHTGVRWSVSRFRPPLPYDDGHFRIVYSISVFTHLDEFSQDAWLEEVRRVLAPGGVALLSVCGEHAFEQFRSKALATAWCRRDAFDRPSLAADEFVFEPYARSFFTNADLTGTEGPYGLAFHGARYIRERWSRRLNVEAVRERGLTGLQDLVICTRPASKAACR